MITSAANPRLKLVRRLQTRRGRERLGLFVCEGEDIVAAALEAGLEPVEALLDAERPALVEQLPGAEPVAAALLASASELPHPPRVIAVFRRADLPRLDPKNAPPVGLALWHVGDPGNVGALLRSADALGPAFVCLSEGCADPVSPKALRASAGAIFRVPVGPFEAAPGPAGRAGRRGPDAGSRTWSWETGSPSCSAASARACRPTSRLPATRSRRSRSPTWQSR